MPSSSNKSTSAKPGDSFFLISLPEGHEFRLTVHCSCGHTSHFTREDIIDPLENIRLLDMGCKGPNCERSIIHIKNSILEVHAERYEFKVGPKAKRKKRKARKAQSKKPIVVQKSRINIAGARRHPR
jgi:hypothetical protein